MPETQSIQSILSFLGKQRFPIYLLPLGFILIILSHFDVVDIRNWRFSRTTDPIAEFFVFGVILISIPILLYVLEEVFADSLFRNSAFGWRIGGNVQKINNGFSAIINRSRINIVFGRIEEIESDTQTSLIILPSNEFFDDECIYDRRSALGAFIQTKYPNLTPDIQKLIQRELAKTPCEDVEKETGTFRKSYRVGTCIFLDEPPLNGQKLLFVSVTTKRAGEGLRAEMSYIFKVIKKIHGIAADKRLNSVYIPLIGSGHGGLRKEVALFGMLLAVCDSLTRQSGHKFESFNIIIYQASNNHKPDVPPEVAKRLLGATISMFLN